jgi:hypothetical protein
MKSSSPTGDLALLCRPDASKVWISPSILREETRRRRRLPA